jgi:hypothetical protein
MRHPQVSPIDPDAEFACSRQEIRFRRLAARRIEDADADQVNTFIVLRIESPNVHLEAGRLEHHGYSVELIMARMKYMAGHDSPRLDRDTAEFIERRCKIGGDGLGGAAFNHVTMHHEYRFTIPE